MALFAFILFMGFSLNSCQAIPQWGSMATITPKPQPKPKPVLPNPYHPYHFRPGTYGYYEPFQAHSDIPHQHYRENPYFNYEVANPYFNHSAPNPYFKD